MNEDEFKGLSDKVRTGSASREELLQFLQELNSSITEIRKTLKKEEAQT